MKTTARNLIWMHFLPGIVYILQQYLLWRVNTFTVLVKTFVKFKYYDNEKTTEIWPKKFKILNWIELNWTVYCVFVFNWDFRIFWNSDDTAVGNVERIPNEQDEPGMFKRLPWRRRRRRRRFFRIRLRRFGKKIKKIGKKLKKIAKKILKKVCFLVKSSPRAPQGIYGIRRSTGIRRWE